MSRRHGGRPGYGWSSRQQGGFRRAGAVRHIYKRGSLLPTSEYSLKSTLGRAKRDGFTLPTSEHSLKSTLGRARREGWLVDCYCKSCKRVGRIAAFELLTLHNLDADMSLPDLEQEWKAKTCPACKVRGDFKLSYSVLRKRNISTVS